MCVNPRLADIDDEHLERLFEQARRYPLLKAEQERELDGRKWQAVARARHAILASPGGRRLLGAFVAQWREQPPRIEQFAQREHHFVLKRELQSTGSDSESLAALQQHLASRRHGELAHMGEALGWSATLWTGLAATLARALRGDKACQVADAIGAWAAHWRPRQAPLAPEADTRAELHAALSDFDAARDALTLHNLRLVYTIAGRYLGRGVALSDLVQEGSLGLMRAAEKFEARKGYRFSTYGFNWIAQAVRRAVGDSGALIRYPTHVREQVNKLHSTRETLLYRHGRTPSEERVAAAAGLELARARELRQLRNFASPLDAPLHDSGDATLADQLPDDRAAGASRGAELRSLQRRVLVEIAQLDDTERRVVLARWGLHDGPPLSRGELADQLAVSREWVRQLEVSALDKLRHNSTLRELFGDFAAGA